MFFYINVIDVEARQPVVLDGFHDARVDFHPPLHMLLEQCPEALHFCMRRLLPDDVARIQGLARFGLRH